MIKKKLYCQTRYPKPPNWMYCTYFFGILIKVIHFRGVDRFDVFEIIGKEVTIYHLPSNKTI